MAVVVWLDGRLVGAETSWQHPVCQIWRHAAGSDKGNEEDHPIPGVRRHRENIQQSP